ncbi:DNA ligase (ATP) [Aspergillus nanangensis]|uniref:DNA ligase n=1 Tax=Aspergillus nanangensis TaxID=2582783 RepID=A0AAD4CXL1_ASPNN|nr:DNA ligase (ATP) [Aspergillus nanangensis]
MDLDSMMEPEQLTKNPPADDEGSDLDEKFPNRPRNHSQTLPFHELYQTLFNPLSEIKKKPAGAATARRKLGPHGQSAANLNPLERRRDIIERFISRWRKEVGDDIYPAFRLILPDKDRDRAMYGIKEKVIGKMLVKIMKIDKNSEDGFNLLNWKLPGQMAGGNMAGDFAGRCYDVISKRPMRTEAGNVTIEEVNAKLDQLSAASKEDQQLPILADFYRHMNAEEMLWLIRIILRQMKVGATERTFFDVWHPDAENLYSISSSLRRVCWELHDPNIRLEAEDRGISLMQCYQPQLAQFQMQSLDRMISRLRPTEDDPVFWIEEKLDGERMQLHMQPDNTVAGGRRFRFWSRKAKDYTYLYGNGVNDVDGALTRYLQDAFADGVESLILDGEMITWDPEHNAPAPFGTLKTAALAEQRNPFANGARPLFRVFDILYLNGRDLTRYTLRDRRNALQKSIKPVPGRFEIHPYQEAIGKAEVEAALRTVVAEASEGLVLKNPRSPYRLNERHDDWMKVKPEYMTEFGESLDLVVIGGGFNAADYANIRHHTDGKWIEWNPKKPPTSFIELAGGDAQYERPDMWIKPEDSVVLCVKAASVSVSDQFRNGLTLRFPRFKRLRMDKNWKSALSVQEFLDLKSNVEQEQKEKEFSVDNSRKKRIKRTNKKPLTVAGYDADAEVQYIGPSGNIFDGMSFFVMTDSNAPIKKSKPELEQLVKTNGGKLYQTSTAAPHTICIADRRTVKAASIQKSGNVNIIRPSWVLDCIRQNEIDAGLPNLLLSLEPKHMFFTTVSKQEEIEASLDQFNDSYSRDSTTEEVRSILEQMSKNHQVDATQNIGAVHKLAERIHEQASDLPGALPGWLFKGLTVSFPQLSSTNDTEDEGHTVSQPISRLHFARNTICFAGGRVVDSLKETTTHVIVTPGISTPEISSIRRSLSERAGTKIPHLVTAEWIEECWTQRTLLDEERYQNF